MIEAIHSKIKAAFQSAFPSKSEIEELATQIAKLPPSERHAAKSFLEYLQDKHK